MLSVLGLDFPAAGVLPPGDAAEVLHRPVPATEEQVAVLVDGLVELAGGGRSVLLLHPAHRTLEVTKLVRLLRQVLGGNRIAAVPTTLPPLAAGVLVELLAALAEPLELDAGRAVAAVPHLEPYLEVRCWVRTVRGLTAPAPSLGQHLLSWAAWRGFEVQVRPGPRVRWVRELLTVPAEPVVVRGAARDLLRWHPAPPPLPGHAGTALATRQWFGTGRVVEAVGYPDDLDALAREVGESLRYGDCEWCGLPGPAGPCAFCGIVRPLPAPPAGTPRGGGAASPEERPVAPAARRGWSSEWGLGAAPAGARSADEPRPVTPARAVDHGGSPAGPVEVIRAAGRTGDGAEAGAGGGGSVGSPGGGGAREADWLFAATSADERPGGGRHRHSARGGSWRPAVPRARDAGSVGGAGARHAVRPEDQWRVVVPEKPRRPRDAGALGGQDPDLPRPEEQWRMPVAPKRRRSRWAS
jgi:hypothetical protein